MGVSPCLQVQLGGIYIMVFFVAPSLLDLTMSHPAQPPPLNVIFTITITNIFQLSEVFVTVELEILEPAMPHQTLKLLYI